MQQQRSMASPISQARPWPTRVQWHPDRQRSAVPNAETQNERRRRDFTPPPPPPPPPPRRPPPPPPVPAASGAAIDRRLAILGGGAALLAIGAVLSGGGNMSSEYERDLSYVASQVGVRGMPSPVSAIVDRQGRIVGLDVVGKYGNYVATVDPRNPSILMLKARNGSVYRLPTRYDRINLTDRRAMESVFRTSEKMSSHAQNTAMPMNTTPAPAPLESESLVGLKDACAGQRRHPIDAIQGQQSACKEALRDSVYGSALNARNSIETQLLGRFERLPGFTSSKLGLESLTGKLDDFDFGSYLPSIEEKSLEGAFGDKHIDVLERKFGL